MSPFHDCPQIYFCLGLTCFELLFSQEVCLLLCNPSSEVQEEQSLTGKQESEGSQWPSTYLMLEREWRTSETLEGHSGFPVLVLGCSKNSEQLPDLHLNPRLQIPHRGAGKESSQTSCSHTCVFTHTPAPAAFTGRCPHTGPPGPPTGPSPDILNIPPWPPHRSVMPEHAQSLLRLFPPKSLWRRF